MIGAKKGKIREYSLIFLNFVGKYFEYLLTLARIYWKILKLRLKEENETGTNCN
jgi:hypothetical protein